MIVTPTYDVKAVRESEHKAAEYRRQMSNKYTHCFDCGKKLDWENWKMDNPDNPVGHESPVCRVCYEKQMEQENEEELQAEFGVYSEEDNQGTDEEFYVSHCCNEKVVLKNSQYQCSKCGEIEKRLEDCPVAYKVL